MNNIMAIWQREMKSYFVSPIAYVVLTIFLLIAGVFFYLNLSYTIQATMMQAAYGQGSPPVDVPGRVMMQFFGTISIVLLFLIPLLTMGLFSEEKKRGTIELLLTTPVGNVQAMMGKYLASVTFLLIMFLTTGLTISSLFVYGQPDIKPILAGYLGMFLYGSALLALGLFISTLTENQIVAGVITLGVSLLLLLVDGLASSAPGLTKEVISYLSVISHLDDFIKGVIDTTHVIFYLTFAFFGLFLAYRSLESLRWKS